MSFEREQPTATQRPGAMTAVMMAARPTMSGPRELRIGRVEAGAIVDDRQYRAAVTYGRSEKATLMVSSASIGCAPLFERSRDGTFTLFVPAGAQGRLALVAGTIDLAELAGTSIPLDASARGKLVLDETTLLFQLVAPASTPLRPRLPSAARGGFLSMIDWRFTSYVMASMCAHLIFVAWLDSADFAIDASATVLPDQLAHLIVEMPDPPPVIPDVDDRVLPPEPTEIATNDVTPNVPVRPAPPSRDRSTPAPQPMNAEDIARMTREIAERAGTILVGSNGPSDRAFVDLIRSATTGGAQEILDGVGGVQIATGPSSVLRTRSGGGNGSGEGGLGALVAAGRNGTTQRPEGTVVQEVLVRCRNGCMSEPEPLVQQSGDRDGDSVVAMLRARRGAFQACYEGRTRFNPDLRGKVAAQFTISEMGTVSGVRITENGTSDPALGACVASVFQRIRFGEVEGSGDSTFAHAFVFAPQN